MATVNLGLQHDPDLEPKRAKTLFVSICIHIAIFAFLLLNPNLLVQAPRRIIRIAGQDYDLSKNQMTELVMPQQSRPQPKPPVQSPPVQEPPKPEPQPQAAPPPPPPPPPPKEMPPIPPDATLAEGARPDGTPKASRGNTAELRTGSSGSTDPARPAAPKQENSQQPLAQDTNPNSLTLKELASKILQDQQTLPSQRFPGTGNQGPRTGNQGPPLQENPDFSTEEPRILSPTYGYDFGPYLNQVLNRIRYNWYSLIPEIARYSRGRVVVIFTIQENGGITDAHIVANSGKDPLDRAAFGSITGSNPFPKLPSNFEGDHLSLQITFLYNINPQ
jgi:TonB family protein